MSIRLTVLSLAAILLTSTVVRADDTAASPKTDSASKSLQGRWEIVSGFNQGRELPESYVEGTFVMITANKIVTYDRDERETYRAVFRIDESKKPMHITMTTVPKNPPANELKSKDQYANAIASGILKFDGQTKWTLCYALPGADRPKKFESPEGSKIMMFTMEKKEGDPVPDSLATDPTE